MHAVLQTIVIVSVHWRREVTFTRHCRRCCSCCRQWRVKSMKHLRQGPGPPRMGPQARKIRTPIKMYNNVNFSAPHGMPARTSYEEAVCPSVCPSIRPSVCMSACFSNAWIVTKGRKICPDIYTIRFSLVFREEEWLFGTSRSTWNFGSSWPRWSEIADFQ